MRRAAFLGLVTLSLLLMRCAPKSVVQETATPASTPTEEPATLYYGNPPEHSSGHNDLPARQTYADDFHIFAVEWETTEIRWYIDDHLFHSVNK